MHVRRQLNRFFGSLRRKSAVKNKLENLSDNELSEGEDVEKRKEGKRLTFHNLSLRLKRTHKENSLSQCQLLNVDDEENQDAHCQKEQETDAVASFAYDSASLPPSTTSFFSTSSYCGPHFGSDDDLVEKHDEREGKKGMHQDDGIKSLPSANEVGGQPKFGVTISDMEMDFRHAPQTNDHYPQQIEEWEEPSEISNVLSSHFTSSLAKHETAHSQSYCNHCGDKEDMPGEAADPTKNVTKKTKKSSFRGGVRKSVKSVRKAFQDGFVAWGHSMTYASSVMPSFYECPAPASAMDPYGYYSNNYIYDYRDVMERGNKTMTGQSLKNNYSLQCSHPSNHSQLSY